MDERKIVRVDREELESSFAMVSMGAPGANEAWISIATGKIKWRMESGVIDEDDEESDEDFHAEGVIEIPHERELGLGSAVVMRFAGEVMPDDSDTICDMFQQAGAYGRLKAFLARRGRLERWHQFEDEAATQALLEWCQENDVEPVDRLPDEAG